MAVDSLRAAPASNQLALVPFCHAADQLWFDVHIAPCATVLTWRLPWQSRRAPLKGLHEFIVGMQSPKMTHDELEHCSRLWPFRMGLNSS
jgi:hypothetical protein